MRAIRRHLTYANIVLTILAFIVLGGTAWALAKNSVGSKQLKTNAVTTKKIKNGAITSAKIAKGAVTGADIKPTSFNVTVHQVAASPIPPNTSGIGSIDAAHVGGATATCPAGQKAIAGGGLSDPSTNGGFIEDSRPVTQAAGGTGIPAQDGTFSGWRVIWLNFGNSTPLNPVVYVVCLG